MISRRSLFKRAAALAAMAGLASVAPPAPVIEAAPVPAVPAPASITTGLLTVTGNVKLRGPVTVNTATAYGTIYPLGDRVTVMSTGDAMAGVGHYTFTIHGIDQNTVIARMQADQRQRDILRGSRS